MGMRLLFILGYGTRTHTFIIVDKQNNVHFKVSLFRSRAVQDRVLLVVIMFGREKLDHG